MARVLAQDGDIAIDELSLRISDSYVALLYDVVLWMAENAINNTVLESVNQQLGTNIATALQPINDDERVRQAMGMLLDHVGRAVKRASTATRWLSEMPNVSNSET